MISANLHGTIRRRVQNTQIQLLYYCITILTFKQKEANADAYLAKSVCSHQGDSFVGVKAKLWGRVVDEIQN